MPRGADVVANAADGRNNAQGQLQAGAGEQALVDGQLKAGVESIGVPHGRVAGGQRLLQHGSRAHMRRALRLVEPPTRHQAIAVVR